MSPRHMRNTAETAASGELCYPSKIDDRVKQRLVWEPDGVTVLISAPKPENYIWSHFHVSGKRLSFFAICVVFRPWLSFEQRSSSGSFSLPTVVSGLLIGDLNLYPAVCSTSVYVRCFFVWFPAGTPSMVCSYHLSVTVLPRMIHPTNYLLGFLHPDRTERQATVIYLPTANFKTVGPVRFSQDCKS